MWHQTAADGRTNLNPYGREPRQELANPAFRPINNNIQFPYRADVQNPSGNGGSGSHGQPMQQARTINESSYIGYNPTSSRQPSGSGVPPDVNRSNAPGMSAYQATTHTEQPVAAPTNDVETLKAKVVASLGRKQINSATDPNVKEDQKHDNSTANPAKMETQINSLLAQEKGQPGNGSPIKHQGRKEEPKAFETAQIKRENGYAHPPAREHSTYIPPRNAYDPPRYPDSRADRSSERNQAFGRETSSISYNEQRYRTQREEEERKTRYTGMPSQDLLQREPLRRAYSPEDSARDPRRKPADESYYVDLEHWLDLTGYHDVEYRRGVIQRDKERIDLESRRLALERAELAEAQKRMHIHRPGTAAPESIDRKVDPSIHHAPRNYDDELRGPPRRNTSYAIDSPYAAGTPGLKRRFSGREFAQDDYPDRSRVKLEGQDIERDRNDRYVRPNPPRSFDRQHSSIDEDLPTGSRRDQDDRRHSIQRDDKRRQDYERPQLPRQAKSSKWGRIQYLDVPPVRYGQRNGDSRFFMVKSYNADNVEQAMEEDIWATQAKNEQLFREAFENTEHVFLVFSINKSQAFQGYARMESTTGTAPSPGWCKNLLWPSSGAFRIRWITIAETRFSKIGHIRNRMNDDQPVLIGRDGQEIDEDAGCRLLEGLDYEADRQAQYGPK